MGACTGRDSLSFLPGRRPAVPHVGTGRYRGWSMRRSEGEPLGEGCEEGDSPRFGRLTGSFQER